MRPARALLLCLLPCLLALSACGGGGGGGDPVSWTQRLIVQPDDGRAPILEAIAGATNSIRLTIYQITDLQSVAQSPAAPADSVVAALIGKARSGVSVRVVVDRNQYDGTNSTGAQIRQTVADLRSAGAVVHTSSAAFCVTHQKTFVIDGPTAESPDLRGTAIIMSLNLTPGYFGGTRDYAVITNDPAVVSEASRVFDSDFTLVNPGHGCSYADSPGGTYPPPYASDTPPLSVAALLWSPVSSKPKLLELIGSARQSLVLTTEEMGDAGMVCQIKAVAESPSRPSVRILLSGDTGSNAAGVKTLLDLGLPNLSIRVMPGLPSPPDAAPQTPLYMHGKQVIVDGVQAFVGSENLTNTSLIQNRELGIFFSDPGMIARLQNVFTTDFATPTYSLPAQACTSGPGCATIVCP
jgi:cardiolipin synthase A/B